MPRYDQDDFPNFPADVNSKPDRDDFELRAVFEDNDWVRWGDFLNDRYGLANDDPSHSRPPALTLDLDGIRDLLIDFNDRGLLDYVSFEFGDDGYTYYEVGDTGGKKK